MSDTPITNEDKAVKRVTLAEWELKKRINGAALIIQLMVTEQNTIEGKAYYDGQFQFRRALLSKINELFHVPSPSKGKEN